MSDDGLHALTLIGFIGSVFSPYYALQRRLGPREPMEHCALNVALYGAKRRWAMTERSSKRLYRDARRLEIGPSSIVWDKGNVDVLLDEVTFPLPSRIRGRIKVIAEAQNQRSFLLSQHQEHNWWPLLPRARIEVDLPLPGVRWSGEGYLDCNWGSGPLEQSFRRWAWSRTSRSDGSSDIYYDVDPRDDAKFSLALAVSPEGRLTEIAAPAQIALPTSRWGIERLLRCHPSEKLERLTALEDGPFYARTLIQSKAAAGSSKTVHESLCLDRFSSPWVQAMLPFRMPRTRR